MWWKVLLVGPVWAGEPIIGIATAIDGDTLKLNSTTIRLHAIDAPEVKQICWNNTVEYRCGFLPKEILGGLPKAGPITCQPKKAKDPYKRTIDRCTDVNGKDLQANGPRRLGADLP